MKRELLGPVEEALKPVEDLASFLTRPVEEAFREAVGDVLYRQLTNLGEARRLEAGVDPAKLLESVKRQLGVV